ncbi:SCAI-like protein [Drosera capensis]
MAAKQNSSGIPLIEVYWSLVAKAEKKFSKIRDLPLYERSRYDSYFSKVFKVYTELWKFQQENRQKLVESGLKRWEIGDIASRIAQIYFGQYMRTGDASYLYESYVFYEAIFTREYFKEGLFQLLNLANKHLRFLARFIMVSLLLGRREMVRQLANQLRTVLDECKRVYQDVNFKEWKVVLQEIVIFQKVDSVFMNMRPLRYSLVLDAHPDRIRHVSAPHLKRNLRLRDGILCSYHPHEVKFSEITLDTYRMLQCLEWEPSGSFYKSGGSVIRGSNTGVGQNGTRSTINQLQDLTDPTLPCNPRKAVLYRASSVHFLAVLGTAFEELPSDGVLLLYLSGARPYSASPGRDSIIPDMNTVDNIQSLDDTSNCDTRGSPGGHVNEVCLNSDLDCIRICSRGNEGLNRIYPCDLLPFTRKPLFLVIDSESSSAFKTISGAEKGVFAILLLSPRSTPSIATADLSHQNNGSLFTMFLTTPIQAFCHLLGISASAVDADTFDDVEKLLSSSVEEWGTKLATESALHPAWGQGTSLCSNAAITKKLAVTTIANDDHA